MKIFKLTLVLVCLYACGKEKFEYPDPDPHTESKNQFLGKSYVLDSIKPIDKIDTPFTCALGDTISFQLSADSSCKAVLKPDKNVCIPGDSSIKFFLFDADTWTINLPIYRPKYNDWHVEFCRYSFSFGRDYLYVTNYLSLDEECTYVYRRTKY